MTEETKDYRVDQIVPIEDKDDDYVIDRVRAVRLSVMETHIAQGVPVDTVTWTMFNQNLQELDKSAQKSKQMKAAAKTADQLSGISGMIADQMMKAMGLDPYASKDGTEGTIPDPSGAIEGQATVIEGELKIGDDTGKYDDFQNTIGKELDEKRRAGLLK